MISSNNAYDSINQIIKFKTSEEIDAQISSFLKFGLREIQQNGIYVFGAGRLGQQVCRFLLSQKITIHGYIDNSQSLQGTHIESIPVLSPDVLNSNDIVYIASEVYLNPIRKQLLKTGIVNNLSHLQGCILFKGLPDFPLGMYLHQLSEDIIVNKEKYLEVFSLLQDSYSKDVFNNLLLYRLTGNIDLIDQISASPELEYFDSTVLRMDSSEVFYDCGGFDGDSAQHFIDFAKKHYTSIHVFEPDKILLSKAKQRLGNFERIHYNEVGIFNKTTTLKFDNTGGLDGKINESGSVQIKVIALDDYESDKPTYIKLDIEGVEIEALDGAKELIKNQHPKLAIASYHYPRHFWEVPLHVLSINKNYTLFLRHYSNYIMGSTYYFIPT